MKFRSAILWLFLASLPVPGAAQSDNPLDGLFGDFGSNGNPTDLLKQLEQFTNPTPGQIKTDSSDFSNDLERAKTCSQPLSLPIIDNLIVNLLNQPITEFGAGDTANIERQFGSILALLPDDPCTQRLKLLGDAWLGVRNGEYLQAFEVTDQLLPSLEQERSALNAVGHLVKASLLALQQRNEEAKVSFVELEGHIQALFGENSRLALTVRGALNDVELQLADEKRNLVAASATNSISGSDPARSPYQDILEQTQRLKARAQAALGDSDPYLCNIFVSEAEAHLRMGNANAAVPLLETVLGGSASCQDFASQSHYISARARHYLGRGSMAMGDLGRSKAILLEAHAQVESQRGTSSPLRIEILRAQAELAALEEDPDTALSHMLYAHEALAQWLGGEIRGTATRGQRRLIVALQADQMDLAVLLAVNFPVHEGLQDLAA